MATHHVICLMLFSMNVLTNRLLPTVALTLCCSVTDVVMTLTRVFIDTEYNKVGGLIAVALLMPSWFYFRLVAYPYNLYQIMVFSNKFNKDNNNSQSLDNIFIVMLTMIILLSIYWLYLIVKSTSNYLKKGITNDAQDYSENKKVN